MFIFCGLYLWVIKGEVIEVTGAARLTSALYLDIIRTYIRYLSKVDPQMKTLTGNNSPVLSDEEQQSDYSED
jgi:hypothetical protein